MKKVVILAILTIWSFVNVLKAQTSWTYNSPFLYYNGGNVGIGTTTPWSGANLTVENVIATKPSGVNGYYSYLKSNWSQDNAFELGINDGSNWHKLVTSSNYHFGSILQFWTADIERIRISPDGNVGIGTASPLNRLQVSTQTNASNMTLGSSNGVAFSIVKGDEQYGLYSGISGNGDAWVQVGRTNTATAYNLLLQTSGGNVGIGTTAPEAKLSVNSGSTSLMSQFESTTANGYIKFLQSGTPSFYMGNSNSGGLLTGSLTNSFNLRSETALHFAGNGDQLAMTVTNGKVGIGTTTPARKLSVFGETTGGQLRLGYNDNWYWELGRENTSTGRFMITCQSGEKFSILDGGNVGIGTTTPSNTLTLSKMLGGANLARITFDGQTGDANNTINGGIEFHNDNYNYYSAIYGYRGGDSEQTGLQLKVSSGTSMTILPNMNVGIGTTNPRTKLSVASLNNVFEISPGATTTIETIDLSNTSNSVNTAFYTRNGYFSFNTGDYNERLRIINNGNVGIGTTTPQYKLAVKGTIGCGEVKVEDITTWADFVFYPTYKLRTLGEVEQFIKANNHLPEIPTAKEVKKNGVGLGEMNAKLLQKVEELTLYMIEQQKQLNELKEQNAKLATEMETLKNK